MGRAGIEPATWGSKIRLDKLQPSVLAGAAADNSLATTVVWQRGKMRRLYRRVSRLGEHAFVWEGGKMKELASLGGVLRTAVAINNRGQIAGSSATKSGEVHAVPRAPRHRERFRAGAGTDHAPSSRVNGAAPESNRPSRGLHGRTLKPRTVWLGLPFAMQN
jgi:hypothetical protein